MTRRIPPSAHRVLEVPRHPAADLDDGAERLLAAARELGFDPVGIAPPRLPDVELERLQAWIARSHHGSMSYMASEPAGRADAGSLLQAAGAVLVVGLTYPPARGGEPPPGAARISTYAQAPYDYHRVLSGRLRILEALYADLFPGRAARRFCDTAPLMERPFALLAGLGFLGKNTQVISARRGSFFFLGGLVVDQALPPTTARPDALGSCGSCTRCLTACPTDAFPAPYVLDARRCISYLTIEHRGPFDEDLRRAAGAHAFGCDVCQAVCPWNLKFAATGDPELAPDPERVDPPAAPLARRLLASFKSMARRTPWERPGKRGFLRNLANVLGNVGGEGAVEALEELARHEDPGVSEHATWALDMLDEG